jgi:hypothetical protein
LAALIKIWVDVKKEEFLRKTLIGRRSIKVIRLFQIPQRKKASKSKIIRCFHLAAALNMAIEETLSLPLIVLTHFVNPSKLN